MENHNDQVRWPDLVRALVSLSNMSQVGRDLGVSAKEVKRWIANAVNPDGENAKAILRLCESSGRINWRTYQGLNPVYDFDKTFDRNVHDGPRGLQRNEDLWLPQVPVKSIWGRELNSPIGVPASILTINSDWIAPLADLGFDIMTVKTCRTREKPAHPMRNVGYVPELRGVVPVGTMPASVVGTADIPHENPAELAIANSFGMPDRGVAEWQADLRKSIQIVERNGGQILIASVVGTADGPDDDLIADFVECSRLANECGPHALEHNWSCPNDYGEARSVFQKPARAAAIARATREALPNVKLLAKIGYLSPLDLEALFEAVYPYVDGFTCINTISARIVSAGQDHEPFFPGEKRITAGISGPAIRDHAIETVRGVRALADKHKPDLVILGVGGVSSAEHVREFLKAGANAVQICTAALFDPLVASKIRHELARDSGNPRKSQMAKDVAVTFRDANIALAFERTISVSNRDGFYFDECWAVVESEWLSGYRETIKNAELPGEFPLRTRREAPSEQQIRTWVRKNARSRR